MSLYNVCFGVGQAHRWSGKELLGMQRFVLRKGKSQDGRDGAKLRLGWGWVASTCGIHGRGGAGRVQLLGMRGYWTCAGTGSL